MTAGEKALSLCQSFGKETLFDKECNEGKTLPFSTAKRMALIAVDEIINLLEDSLLEWHVLSTDEIIDYWNKVKQEIEKI